MARQTQTGASLPGPGATPEAASAESEPTLDVVFDLLSNERRRWVLRYLLAESGPTTLGRLAEHIAALENDKPEGELTSAERKRVYICLYQSHLPKLDGADVVDFDPDRKTVEVDENFEQVTAFLTGASGGGPPAGRESVSNALADALGALLGRFRKSKPD